MLTVSVIVATILFFTAISNAQPDYSNQYQQGSQSLSWEMYRQQQVELQIEIQRQQLEIRRQQLELQQQQLEIQRQQLEIQRQQRQMELEKQEIERQNK
ncbi:MAG: hypothetical protein ACYDHW_15790 [Syntrophorhabdaceae bacterium]